MNDPDRPHVVVIGGGIAGLSAAWTLTRPRLARDPAARTVSPRVTLFESAPRLGGKIHTSEFAGCRIEDGPDAFLTRDPWALRLCHELGLDNELVSPARQRAWLWQHGRLQTFPERTVLGVPSGLFSLARNGSVSRGGIFRAAADYVLPASVGRDDRDPTIADTMRRRLGDEVAYRLIDPLVGGINGSSIDSLSLMSAAPQLADLSTRHRSLMRAARATLDRNASNETGTPAFCSLRGGLSTLVDALEKQLVEAGVSVRTNTEVAAVVPTGDAWGVGLREEQISADGVIVATPAYHAATILRTVNRGVATALEQIRYSSVTIIRLAYNTRALSGRLDGSGFLVPSAEGRLVRACSWTSSKWPDACSDDQIILRASVGRIEDERADAMTDGALIDVVHAELSEAMGLTLRPREAEVVRWPDSFPQYEPGHASRVHTAETGLSSRRAIALAGAAYHGLGIPSCVRSGAEAAEHLLTHLGHAHDDLPQPSRYRL